MKKFSIWMMTIAMLCVCTLFSACTTKDEASITFNKTNATIYLGETENNQVSILATVNNADVKKLDLVYDTSYITISQTKNSDGTFTITVKSLIDYGTKPIAVEVKAGTYASAVFYVDIVLPLQRIVPKDNLYVAYNGTQTVYNLLDFISYEPEGTVQKGVEFTLVEESEQIHIAGNNLVIDAGVNFNDIRQIKINALSTVVQEGKSPVSAELNVKVIPNVELLADNINVLLDYNGEKAPIQNRTYELTIKKDNNGYTLSTFIVEITIPQSLGIEVDIDAENYGGLSTNILNYLSYAKSCVMDTTNASNIKDVYTFTFQTKSSLQGKGDLRFKYWYKDHKADNNLSASFVAKIDNEIVKKVSVVATMPITQINVNTNCTQNPDTKIYTIYNDYNNTYGEAFTFVALPEGTSQRTLVLEKPEGSALQVYNSKGNLLTFVRNIYDENGTLIETKYNQQEITSGETIYIKGGDLASESLTYYSALADKEDLTKGTLNFNVVKGTSALGFVSDTDSTDLKEDIVLNAEINDVAVAYLLAPNALATDFIKNDNVYIEPVDGKDNYFKVTFSALTLGKQTYVIKTPNGYKVTANLNVIQPLERAILGIKNNSQYISGIGDYSPKNNDSLDLANISIEKGYSIQLNYNINPNAEIARIKYSFYNTQNIDVYGEEIQKLKDIYNYNYPTLFDDISFILNNQNLMQTNILTGTATGVNIIKIEIYGQKVVDGAITEEIKFTKYLFVQIYNPVKQITSTAKNITLRALDQVASYYESLTTKTLSLEVLSDSLEKATYNKLFIDGSSYDTILNEDGTVEYVCSQTISRDGVGAIDVVYNLTTGKLTIKANKYVVFDEPIKISLFAGDFVDFEVGRYIYSDYAGRPITTYDITINLIETKVISDINVSNLTLDEDKSDSTTKVYKTIYIDTSKAESVTYKLYTEITPYDAFDKSLNYTFTPNSGNTQAMIDIADDGTITVLGDQGGSGIITIEPRNYREGMNVRTVKIPIIVTDGNSWETAYEITSLNEIKYPNKHYVLTIPTTYNLTNTLFNDLEGGFRGGLYGRRYGDTTSAKATIYLNGVSLFNELSSNAHIADLNIYGDVKTVDYKDAENNNVAYTKRGFVANYNAGLIENVKITSYISNGTYVPSLLTIGENVTMVGGIAGENVGRIDNCTFAGSINIKNNNTVVANAIANNTNGTVSNCKVITAKYNSEANSGRLVNDGESFVNGVVGGENITFADIDNNIIKEENYKDYQFNGNVWIANYIDENYEGLYHSYGEEDNAYGLVFYYEAKDKTKQNNLTELNIIPFSKLFGLKNTNITTENLKILAYNADNSLCNFIGIDSQGIVINGIGQFILSIFSEYDYTTTYELNVLSLYQASEFTLSSNGVKLDKNSQERELIFGQKYEVISKLNNLISIINKKGQRETIELKQNDYELSFTISYENAQNEIDADKYITGKKLGSHTINMNFDWYDTTNIKVRLVSGSGANYDALINRLFNIADGDAGEFNVRRKNGTTAVTTDVKEGSIEPKDTFTFFATLTTDLTSDAIVAENIEIYTENNSSITDKHYFDIFVEKTATGENTYKIQLRINQERIREEGYNLLDFVARKYSVIVRAVNIDGIDKIVYDAFATVEVTLLPQTIANINTVLYGVTSSNTTGVNVADNETPTSVLIPSGNGGLFVIDMFPAFASYDYIDVVATANTVSKLSFRLQDRIVDNGVITNNYKNASNGYEPLTGQNGIRLLNNNIKDNHNIGTYYLKVFTDATFSGDTIFTITVNAYYKNSVLTAQSVFTLYMRMPEAPQISLNGETKVYALAGSPIKGIEVLVSQEQINPYARIAATDSGESVIDGKTVSNIQLNMTEVTENSLVGYRRYSITVVFNQDYISNLSTNSTKFKIVVTSTKISSGGEIPVSAEMYVYVVNYKPTAGDIKIFNASENKFKVTSLKYLELKLADLIPEEIYATQEFIDSFAENYYYNNTNTEFNFGKNTMLVNGTEKTLSKAQVLASYLSYVKGNVKTPLLKINNLGEFDLVSNEYISFDIQDGKLLVKGGDYTGTTNMIMEIEYKMPDGRVFTYEYSFDIINSLYTTEDLPKEIANSESFLGIVNEEEAHDYILTNDLYLYDFTTIANTNKITSFDGNNHTIHIINYAESDNATEFALFNNVASTTTIKNLTVNIYHLRQILVSDKVTSVNIAGFAIQNDGAIYNCEVVAYDNKALPSMSNTYGIKINEDVESRVAGFVLTNNGSITNSRFGGTQKLATNVEYLNDDNGKIVKRVVRESLYDLKMITIKASGTISGFVESNNGVIASSFVKNINIQNTYYKLETKVTAGFINTNNGTVAMCYAEGDFANNTDIRSTVGGLEGSGIMAGFAYTNYGTITDSYSNLSITNSKEQVGRLGAGFIYENSENGVIERSYSASKIISNNISQMNFAGIKDFGGYNNGGTIKTSYYYIENSTDEISIESTLTTSINAIINIADRNEFYGFSFAESQKAGTWTISDYGRPALISPNDIAHSVRAKYENTTGANTSIEYYFVYCDGYELGSYNNPIIIRDAKEFNSVFGSSISTDISDNYDLSANKVYGTYRLVNNVDMLDLVPEEEQDTEYKVNLVSTKMTLSGEYTNSSHKSGSLNGNGLTISNLAISNSSTKSYEFGLFKSLENGASISNINVELARGGVTADHTIFVGTIAGSVVDSYANNITIKGTSVNDYTKVIGANVTGGVFGRVVGNSKVSNCAIENVSVTSTYYTALLPTEENVPDTNTYNRANENKFAELSISGGAFGVVDVYTTEQQDNKATFGEVDSRTPSIANISVKGGVYIEGMTAGGVAGFIGNYVIGRDLSFTIVKEGVKSGIIAYNCYAGGIVGFNRGYLYQLKAEHEQEWQKEIENNMQAYYKADDANRDSIDRGSLDIFASELNYKPYAIGGLVGVQQSGKISIAYSKLNVLNNNGINLGGAVGLVCKAFVPDGTSVDDATSFTMHETYAVGDVFSSATNAHIGGIIGSSKDNGIKLTKVNALNYWGKDAFNKFKLPDEKNIHAISDQSEGDSKTHVYSIYSINFGTTDDQKYRLYNKSDAVMRSYYEYNGVLSDNGAQIDLMFSQKEWYIENNWSRDLTELFPHIVYVSPKNQQIIQHKEDFYKFALYGNDPNVTFIVVDNRDYDPAKGEEDLLIDCDKVNANYGLLRAKIVGATTKNGFRNLYVPLFNEVIGNEISTLRFYKCYSAITQKANNEQFSYLNYSNCNFQVRTSGNIGGVAQEAIGKCSFMNITFSDSDISAGNSRNAGYLFGKHSQADADNVGVEISDISIRSEKNNALNVSRTIDANGANESDGSNYGLLFGMAGKVRIKNVNIFDNANIILTPPTTQDEETTAVFNVNAGILAGSVASIEISLDSVKLLSGNNGGLKVAGGNNQFKVDLNLNAGGIVGKCSDTITLTVDTENAKNDYVNVTYAPKIDITGTSGAHSQYIGTISGQANKILAGNLGMFIFGKTEEASEDSESGKVIFRQLNYSLAEKTSSNGGATNNIGGIAGTLNTITTDDTTKSGEVSESQSDKPGIIAYYGDMNAVTPTNTDDSSTQIFLNLGGIVGYVNGNSENGAATISNVLFDGTIGFDKTFYGEDKDALQNKIKHLYLSEGGVIGKTEGFGITIKNTIASGEILLSNSDGDKFELLDKRMYVAGLIGYNNATTTLGTDSSNGNEKVYVITTLFSLTGAKGVDSIAHNAIDKQLILNNEVRYCSSLNLVVSDLKMGEGYAIPSGTQKDLLSNMQYEDISSSTKPNEKTDSVWNAKGNTVKGSKLDPYIINNLDLSETGKDILDRTDPNRNKTIKEIMSKSENEYFIVRTQRIKTDTQSNPGDIINFISTYTRKMYISVSGDLSLEYQIALKNTILFSQGAQLKSTITPINSISADSAVTGLVVKLYVDEGAGSAATTKFKYVNLGGLANRNDGIIYTCSVQETMNDFAELSNSTQFYGVMNPKVDLNLINTLTVNIEGKVFDTLTKPRGVAGFVANNTGYIFGSNANVHMHNTGSVIASNFVVANSGTISYSYATGVNESDKGYLFVANPKDATLTPTEQQTTYGTIENCYTIVKAINDSVSSYVPNKTYKNEAGENVYPIYVESDASEIDFTAKADAITGDKVAGGQIITLYKATEQKTGGEDGTCNNALILADTKGYYDCDPYCNYNYPTLSGGLFKNFTFLKRSTMVEYNESEQRYTDRDRKINYDKESYEIESTGSSVIGFNYYRQILYCQIPNLTLLKDLNSPATSGSTNNNLTSSYSKFVIVGDINIGYYLSESKTEVAGRNQEDSSILGTIQPNTKLYDTTTGDIPVENAKYASLIIDAQNSTFKNLVLKRNVKLIEQIKGMEGSEATITIKNLNFDSVTLNGVTGLIGAIDEKTTLSNITFKNGTTATVKTENYVLDKSKDEYYNLYWNDSTQSYTNVIGIMVGKNEGTITNCKFLANIVTNDGAEGSYALGGFVGYNTGYGVVEKSKFNGNVYISEDFKDKNGRVKNLDLQVVFGSFVAINDENAKVTQATLEAGALTDFVLTSGGTVYKKEVYDNLIDAKKEEDPLVTGDNAADYQLNAQIYVITSNKAVVGGVVGILKSGLVNRSSTYKNGNKNDLAILVGDEYTQRVSYAGGIVGVMEGNSQIQDCSNRSNITAMATWLFTTTNNSSAKYRFDANNLVIKNSGASTNLSDRVYYSDADSEPKIVSDSNTTKTKLYVYRDMTSLSYAGGIAGLGLKNAVSNSDAIAEGNQDKSGNMRLANYGIISGGFRAVKPVATIYNNPDFNISTFSAYIGWFWGLEATTVAALITDKIILPVPNPVLDGIVRMIAIGTAIGYLGVENALYNMTTQHSLFVDGFIGSSNRYYKENGFVINLFNSDSKWDGKAIGYINNHLGIGDHREDDYLYHPNLNDYNAFGNFIYDSSIKAAIVAFKEHNVVVYPEIILYKLILWKYINYRFEHINIESITSTDLQNIDSANLLNSYDVTKYSSEMKNYYYDGISPSLNGVSEQKLAVYSNTKNIDETKDGNNIIGTFSAGNPDNRFIKFKIASVDSEQNRIDKIKDNYGTVNNIGVKEEDISNWNNTEEHPWVKSRDKCWIPLSESESAIKTGEGSDSINEIVDENGNTTYTYTLSDANNWERLVNTINDDPEKFQHMNIIVDLKNNQTDIPVGKNTLNDFSGSITFRSSRYHFTNMVLSDYSEVVEGKQVNKGMGLIKRTEGVSLISVSVKGTISFTTTGDATEGMNAGILIGQVIPTNSNSKLLIDSSRIVPSSISFTEDSLAKITNFGGIIGNLQIGTKQATDEDQADESEEVKEIIYQSKLNNITLGSESSIENKFNINIQAITIRENTNKNFGGLIGNVNKVETNADKLVLNKITTNGALRLVSEFNNVGGLVGKISDSTIIQLGNDIKTGESNDNNDIQLNVGAAANADTFVGGIIGNNCGIFDVQAPLNIGTQTGVTISADITNESKSAYAGGLVGKNSNNAEIKNTKNNIFMGKKELTSFESISYIFAGYNGMNLESKTAIPKNAVAKLTVGIGYELTGINSYSFITKYMYNDLSKGYTESDDYKSPDWSAIEKVINIDSSGEVAIKKSTETGNDYQLFTTEKNVDDDGDVLNYFVSTYKEQLPTMPKIPESLGVKVPDEPKYVYVDGNGNKEDITLNNRTVLDTTKKLAYKITPVSDNGFKTSDSNEVIKYQWLLEAKYIEKSYSYTKQIANISVTYKFLISLIGANARIEDSGRYTLIVKQLNDFEVKQEPIGEIQITSPSRDESDKVVEKTNKFDLYKTIYKKTEKEKILYSKSFSLTNYTAIENTIFQIKDVFKYKLNSNLNDETKDLGTESHQTSTYKKITATAEFENNFIDFKLFKNGSKYSFKIFDNSSITASADITNADSGTGDEDASGESSSGAKVTKSYNTVLVDLDDISTGDLITGDYVSTDGLFINSYTVKFNGNKLENAKASGEFTSDIDLLGETINYQKPSFSYIANGETYDTIKIYTYSSEDKDAKYVIMSFKKESEDDPSVLLLKEQVYVLNSNNKFNYLGEINYALKDIPNGKTAKDIYDELYAGNGPDRHESYFPTLIDGSNNNYNQAISEVSNDILKKEIKGKEIEFVCNYIDHQINVKTEKDSLYYTYIDEVYNARRTFRLNSSFKLSKVGTTKDNTPSKSERTERFENTSALNGFLSAKQKDGNALTWQANNPTTEEIYFNGVNEDPDAIKISVEYGVWKGIVIAVHIKKTVMVKEPVVDENGDPELDENGDPKYVSKQVTYDYYYAVNSDNNVNTTPYEKKESIKFYISDGVSHGENI